jgi:hypothetical protein
MLGLNAKQSHSQMGRTFYSDFTGITNVTTGAVVFSPSSLKTVTDADGYSFYLLTPEQTQQIIALVNSGNTLQATYGAWHDALGNQDSTRDITNIPLTPWHNAPVLAVTVTDNTQSPNTSKSYALIGTGTTASAVSGTIGAVADAHAANKQVTVTTTGDGSGTVDGQVSGTADFSNTNTVAYTISQAATQDAETRIQLVDADNNNAPVGTALTLTNPIGTATSYTATAPSGYAFKTTGTVSFTPTADDSDNQTIALVHQKKHHDAPTATTDSQYANTHKAYTLKTQTVKDGVTTVVNTQNIPYTRGYTVDEVTNVITYDQWTTDKTFTPYTAPTISGQTAAPATISASDANTYLDAFAKQTTTAAASHTFTITYTPTAAQTADTQIQLVDADNDNAPVGQVITVTNPVGTATSYTATAPAGYAFKTTGTVSFTPTADGTDNQTIALVHQKKHHDAPTATADSQYANTHKAYTLKTQTVKDGVTTVVNTQNIPYTRGYTVDEATNAITYDKWTTDKAFTPYTAPTVSGQTAAPATISASEAKTYLDAFANLTTATAASHTFTITYTPATVPTADTQIQLVDADRNNAPVGTAMTVTNPVGKAARYTATAPAGYAFKTTGTVAFTPTTDDSDNQTIALVHQKTHHDAPTATTDSQYANTHKTYTVNTQTIKDGVTTVANTQTINYTRGYSEDAVTNVITYDQWTAGKAFTPYTAPTFSGYTTSQAAITTNDVQAALSAFARDTGTRAASQTFTITYTPQTPVGVVTTIIDGSTQQTLGTHTFTATGQTYTLPSTGYLLASGSANYTLNGQTLTYTGTATTGKQTLTLTHGTAVVAAPTATTDAAYNATHMTFTLTVTITTPDGKQTVNRQLLHYTRSRTIDLVTQATLSYGQWQTTEHLQAIQAPVVAGYTASPSALPATLLEQAVTDYLTTGDADNTALDNAITYTKNTPAATDNTTTTNTTTNQPAKGVTEPLGVRVAISGTSTYASAGTNKPSRPINTSGPTPSLPTTSSRATTTGISPQPSTKTPTTETDSTPPATPPTADHPSTTGYITVVISDEHGRPVRVVRLSGRIGTELGSELRALLSEYAEAGYLIALPEQALTFQAHGQVFGVQVTKLPTSAIPGLVPTRPSLLDVTKTVPRQVPSGSHTLADANTRDPRKQHPQVAFAWKSELEKHLLESGGGNGSEVTAAGRYMMSLSGRLFFGIKCDV